jgi:hypothetical protein
MSIFRKAAGLSRKVMQSKFLGQTSFSAHNPNIWHRRKALLLLDVFIVESKKLAVL